MVKMLPDKQIFAQLIQENRGIIFKICNSYCANKEDRDDFKFSTWMYRIALNVAISFYRKERKTKTHVPYTENLLVIEEDSAAKTEEEKNLNLLLRFIGELKEIDKSVMLLYLGDKSYKEIAEITGITESNVATKINRIKDKLKSNFLTNQYNFYGTK
jgi:DNA-directed RNA polymerase specialized sigma24 family protein